MERDTILQEQPDRNLLFENQGIVGENYELSYGPLIDDDLGQLAADAYGDRDVRKAVSGVEGS